MTMEDPTVVPNPLVEPNNARLLAGRPRKRHGPYRGVRGVDADTWRRFKTLAVSLDFTLGQCLTYLLDVHRIVAARQREEEEE